MMFKILKTKNLSLLTLLSVLLITLSILTVNSKISFEALCSRFNRDASTSKLENYMKKIKMKNLGIMNEINKDNFLFINSLNSLPLRDLKDVLETDKDTTCSFDEFKARVFAYLYKQTETEISEGNKYKPIGVNLDEEKEPGWRIYIVLMNSALANKHKLLKVCFRENSTDVFSLVMNFDQSCGELIKLINDKEVLKKDNTEATRKLHSMQSALLSNKIKQNYEKGKAIGKSTANSFIEKSAITSTASTTSTMSTVKTFSLNSLAQKFSVEELAKIKSLIKFAKQNNILDDIYAHKGEITIEELNSMNSMKQINSTNSGNAIDKLRSEVGELKFILEKQNKQIGLYFTDMKDMLVVYVKELSSELQKSKLENIGSKLNNVINVSPKLDGNITYNTINSISNSILNSNTNANSTSNEYKFKQVGESINNNANSNSTVNATISKSDNKNKEVKQEEITKLISKTEQKSDIKNIDKAEKKKAKKIKKIGTSVSPFLASNDFDTMEDDDVLESVSNKSKKSKSTNNLDSGDDFIDP